MNSKSTLSWNSTGKQYTVTVWLATWVLCRPGKYLHSVHGQGSDFEGDVPWTFDLIAWWDRLARPFTVRFFLWGYLKSKVYSNRPQTIEQIKDAIRQEITAIPHEMTRRVIDNFRERLWQCVDNNGSHLTDLIFKT